MPVSSGKLPGVLALFEGLTDDDERVAVLLSYADRFRPVPASIAAPPYPASHKVPYCESDAYVWVLPKDDGTLSIHFAVLNPSGVSAKALAAILQETLSGQPAATVAQVPADIVHKIFRQNISMGKGMGLMAMVEAVRALAQQTEVAS